MSKSATRVQDDSRERQIAELCELVVSDRRDGPDAYDSVGNPYEIKSATKNSVTTARDVGLHTIQSWRSKYWIIAIGDNLASGFIINGLWICHPDDLDGRFKEIESELVASWEKCQQVLDAAHRSGVDVGVLGEVRDRLQRGITKNNPKIPLRHVISGGLQLPHSRPQDISSILSEFTRRRPLAALPGPQIDR